MMNVYKLLRGHIKHVTARIAEWHLEKLDGALRQLHFKVYDVMDWFADMHLNAHDDMGDE